MKRLLLTLLLCLLPLCAGAESLTTHIVGRTSEGEHIHQLIADNGQALYFTALEPTPFVKKEDVNFDGAPDIVVCVSQGASNGFFEFFVFDNGAYVQSMHSGLGYGLANYQLYPEKGLVLSQASNGHAGALHEWYLFRWQGENLQLLRSAISVNKEEFVFSENTYTSTVYDNLYEITVSAYGESWEHEVVWQRTATHDDMFLGDILNEELAALWEGL